MRVIIESPLVINGKAAFKDKIQSSRLIEYYQKQLGLEVGKYFSDFKEIGIYECETTKYRFYYPFEIAGDDEFYQNLERFEWYYMPWKWEHELAKKNLKGFEKILEIGSGGLGFVKKMAENGYDITGLELNQKSILKANKLNLNVFGENVQQHAITHYQNYDVVCSFQVLEHISNVHSFLEAQIKCLKPGGHLIVSVPNNNSFLGLDPENCLNYPPHHMGLWTIESIKNLPLIFPEINLISLQKEPLQSYHKTYFSSVMIKYYLERFKSFGQFSNRIVPKVIPKLTYFFPKSIKAFTIQAVYVKLN